MKHSCVRIRLLEGSNPPDRERIQEVGRHSWRIQPWQEYPEGTRIGLYHFRLDVAMDNQGGQRTDVQLDVCWPHTTEVTSAFLDFVYVTLPGGTVRRVSGLVTESVVTVQFSLPPGLSWISTNPPWHIRQNEDWFRKIRQAGARARVIGYSAAKRPIRAVEFGRGPLTAVVLARMHPYESASSFAARGVAEWLARARPRKVLQEWTVSIVPISNPDGVAEGCTRLTGRNGVDLNIEAMDSADQVATVLRRWIAGKKPDVFLNFHNWMSKTANGLYYFEKPELWAFLKEFDRMVWEGRTWYALRIGEDLRGGDPERQVLERHCRAAFGSLCYILEFPWHGSTPQGIRLSGERGFKATLAAFSKLRRLS